MIFNGRLLFTFRKKPTIHKSPKEVRRQGVGKETLLPKTLNPRSGTLDPTH